MNWYHISLLLCFFGFLKEIRPSEPFISDYMQLPYRNVTSEELNRYVYPVATYSNLVLSVIVLLITDLLRYKPIIILNGICGIVTWSLLLWTKSFHSAQLTQVSYSLYVACEVAYFAYIYAKVPKEHFLAVSSHTRAALLMGRFISGILSQLFLYFNLMDIHTLNYFTLGAQIAATSITVFLPSVRQSIYFYREKTSSDEIIQESHSNYKCHLSDSQSVECDKCQQAFTLMWKQLKCAYSNRQIVLWSVWYACGMCAFVQFFSYVQLVWIEIDNRPEVMWNGAIEAVATLFSAAIALLASRLHVNYINTKFKIQLVLFALSMSASGAIFVASNAPNRFLSYVSYILFCMFYNFTITISSAEIAKELPDDSYGLIFGVNTFFAYCLQSILVAIVATDTFELKLSIIQQMNVYGGFLAIVGCLYALLMVISSLPSSNETNTKKSDLNRNSVVDENYVTI
ncbi:folate transporter 1-like [Contarinia nasturtii]|uniref:folate transporter 1-like n=1 Tax=Contarinia nasturtii TaxID=265458 RepID=UPI0012D3DD1C|nr:folate transporter 1-like [Contarinia nasturtii]